MSDVGIQFSEFLNDYTRKPVNIQLTERIKDHLLTFFWLLDKKQVNIRSGL